jgi:hypothetical protein
MSADNVEQHFILRVQNPELASKLRGWLRDTNTVEGRVRLLFDSRKFAGFKQQPAVLVMQCSLVVSRVYQANSQAIAYI